MTRRRDCLMTPHFLIWSFGPKIGYVDRICHQTDSMNRFYLEVKTGPNDKKKRTTTTPNSFFPGENSPPPKFSYILGILYSLDTTLCTTFSILGTSHFVPLGGYIHNGIYYRMRRSLFCTFLSVGRKVEKYRYFGTYVTLILVPSRTGVTLST